MAEDKDNQYVAGKTEKILSPREYIGEPNTGYAEVNQFNRPHEEHLGERPFGQEYPISKGPRYTAAPVTEIGKVTGRADTQEEQIFQAAVDHRLGAGSEHRNKNDFFGYDSNGNPIYGQKIRRGVHAVDKDGNPVIYNEPEFFVKNRLDHFTRDVPQGIGDIGSGKEPLVDEDQTVTRTGYSGYTNQKKEFGVFSGATTNVNALNKPIAAEILKAGTYGVYEDKRVKREAAGSHMSPPISADYNAYRMIKSHEDQGLADSSIFNAYNRTRIPIADQEWRKGFRYIFFTRPECYLMFREGNNMGLCNQAFYDEDFSSAFTRLPHILKLLSPWYVTGSYPTVESQINAVVNEDKIDGSNWNFLFSNRVQGMSVAPTSMTVQEDIGKSIEGYTITPAQFVDSRQGSTIDLTFTDTKNLEVFEMARLWMLYMYKRQKGIFLPPYNGYARDNSFKINNEKLQGPLTGKQFTRMHPYDRALEYCCSLYDIITNETGTKILYWCKYYGLYPVSATPTLDNSNNEAITSVNTTVSFKYHYRLENNNKTLVEFNHDAGLTTDLGKIAVDKITSSLPFLLRDDPRKTQGGNDVLLPKYLGAAGMFTGSPYVVMVDSRPDPLTKDKIVMAPQLRFMNIPTLELDNKYNMGITNTQIDNVSTNIVAYNNLVKDMGESTEKAANEIVNTATQVMNSLF